jgi:hypothetical protein
VNDNIFLPDWDRRPVSIALPTGWKLDGLVLGAGVQPLEVLITTAQKRPNVSELRAVWKTRLAGRATPLLVVTLHDGRAALCGPLGDQPPAFPDLDAPRVQRICQTALTEPDRHRATKFLLTVIPEIEANTPGLRNEGFFATHELEVGVPAQSDWPTARGRGEAVLGRSGEDLLQSLGFTIDAMPGPTSILRAADTRVAIAVLLDRAESPDVSNDRFSGLSPVSYALAKADNENLRFVVVAAGPVLRLYPAQTGVGTGRRGRTETYIELHLDLLTGEQAGYVWMLFSADSLRNGGSVDRILERSADYAADLGVRLRERIYDLNRAGNIGEQLM